MFKNYLTNDFINNINYFFAKKDNITNYFSDYNWYKKCNINSNFYIDIDNTEKKTTQINNTKEIDEEPPVNNETFGGSSNPKNYTKHNYTKNNKLSNKKHLRRTKRQRYIL
jgi:hypothetical protein